MFEKQTVMCHGFCGLRLPSTILNNLAIKLQNIVSVLRADLGADSFGESASKASYSGANFSSLSPRVFRPASAAGRRWFFPWSLDERRSGEA
jgi:hypothetical protein